MSHPKKVEEFSEGGLREPGEVTVSMPPSEVEQYGVYPFRFSPSEIDVEM